MYVADMFSVASSTPDIMSSNAHKFNKMLYTNAKDNFNIRHEDKEAHIKRTILIFHKLKFLKITLICYQKD